MYKKISLLTKVEIVEKVEVEMGPATRDAIADMSLEDRLALRDELLMKLGGSE